MFLIDFRVDYADTDAMAVIYHGRYFRYLERARIEFLRSLGVPYALLEEEGWCLPLTHAEIDYKRSMKFDQKFRVEVKIVERTRIRMTLEYLVTSDGELVAKAKTEHGWCRMEMGPDGKTKVLKPSRAPRIWEELWQKPNV